MSSPKEYLRDYQLLSTREFLGDKKNEFKRLLEAYHGRIMLALNCEQEKRPCRNVLKELQKRSELLNDFVNENQL